MNQELSTTEAKQAATFARKEAEAFDDLSDRATFKEGIEKGIEYALKELLPSRCVRFAAWVQYERVRKGADGKWYFIGTYTKKVFAKDDAELWKKFEEKINDDSLKGFFDHVSF